MCGHTRCCVVTQTHTHTPEHCIIILHIVLVKQLIHLMHTGQQVSSVVQEARISSAAVQQAVCLQSCGVCGGSGLSTAHTLGGALRPCRAGSPQTHTHCSAWSRCNPYGPVDRYEGVQPPALRAPSSLTSCTCFGSLILMSHHPKLCDNKTHRQTPRCDRRVSAAGAPAVLSDRQATKRTAGGAARTAAICRTRSTHAACAASALRHIPRTGLKALLPFQNGGMYVSSRVE